MRKKQSSSKTSNTKPSAERSGNGHSLEKAGPVPEVMQQRRMLAGLAQSTQLKQTQARQNRADQHLQGKNVYQLAKAAIPRPLIRLVPTPSSVVQLVSWDQTNTITPISRDKIQQIYDKLTGQIADDAAGKTSPTAIEGAKGFDANTVMRLTTLGKTKAMQKLGHTNSEWWWSRVILADPAIGGAIRGTRVKAMADPGSGNEVASRNARASNAIYFHATEQSLVPTLMTDGLTTADYRKRNKITSTGYSGLAANAGTNAALYKEESDYSVYVTGRLAEAQQYAGNIKLKGHIPQIVLVIVTAQDWDFDVDADSTGIKTKRGGGNFSNYGAIGTRTALNPDALKLMTMAVGPATATDPRTPLEVYQANIPGATDIK